MKQTRKIRLVFEAEIQQDTELTPEVVARILGRFSNYSPEMLEEWKEDVRHNQTLLTALLNKPELYNHFLLSTLVSTIEARYSGDDLLRLAGENPDDEPLRQLLPVLPAETTAYFEKAIDDGLFSESTDLADFSLEAHFTKVSIENV